MNTAQKGELAVLEVTKRALQKGVLISRPVLESCRYDLILDDGGSLFRAQVKYADGRSTNAQGVVTVNLKRNNKHKHEYRLYKSNEIDVLLVYVAKLDRVCWIPHEVFEDKAQLHLRFEPAKNGQTKGILLIDDYGW